MNTNHTPTPWKVDAAKHSVSIVAGRFCVAQTATAQTGNVAPAEENAAHIVRCVNAHDELVAALRDLLDAADKAVYRPSLDDSRQVDQDMRALREQSDQARAALQKAAKVQP